MIVDTRGYGRTGQRDGADDALKGCDGSIEDRRVIIQVSVECDLLFAQPVAKLAADHGLFTRAWHNCINQQWCDPVEHRYPKNLQDLINAVNEGQEKKLTVRAVGSGHSLSNVAPTNGILLDPKGMKKVLPVDVASLRDPGLESSLFSVESGITIKDLNATLDKSNRALINMGAYDGQTLASAISTRTHGKGIKLGPIASSVRSIKLVSEDKKVYQIEPLDGISDPTKFAALHSDVELIQNDDWFHSAVISMGCMGLIYSYKIAVIETYYLEENRTIDAWEKIRPQLAMKPNGPLPTLLTDYRHFEIDINPCAILGKHACIVQKSTIADVTKPSGTRGLGTWIDCFLAHFDWAEEFLVRPLNDFPNVSPYTIQSALKSLQDTNYINKSFKVLGLGAVNDVIAFAVELSFSVDETLVDNINYLLEVLHKRHQMNGILRARWPSVLWRVARRTLRGCRGGRLAWCYRASITGRIF